MTSTAGRPGLELDHLIVFLPGPPEPPAGLLLDDGVRHVGQGTRNRRIVFPQVYVELLWIDDAEAERASGLGFAERCARAAHPYGLVLRGTRPEGSFRSYAVPDGPTLAIHDGDPTMPFLAVAEMSARRALPVPAHPCGATGVDRVELAGATPPFPGLPGIDFVDGPPEMRVHLTGGGTLRL